MTQHRQAPSSSGPPFQYCLLHWLVRCACTGQARPSKRSRCNAAIDLAAAKQPGAKCGKHVAAQASAAKVLQILKGTRQRLHLQPHQTSHVKGCTSSHTRRHKAHLWCRQRCAPWPSTCVNEFNPEAGWRAAVCRQQRAASSQCSQCAASRSGFRGGHGLISDQASSVLSPVSQQLSSMTDIAIARQHALHTRQGDAMQVRQPEGRTRRPGCKG